MGEGGEGGEEEGMFSELWHTENDGRPLPFSRHTCLRLAARKRFSGRGRLAHCENLICSGVRAILVRGGASLSLFSLFSLSRYESLHMFELQQPTKCMEWTQNGTGTEIFLLFLSPVFL